MKSRIQLFGSVLLAFLVGCKPLPPEKQFVEDALRAVGGRSRIESVKTIVIEGGGVNYNLGQDMRPEAATQTFEITNYKRQIDVEHRRQRLEQTRTPKFAYFQGQQPQVQIQSLDGKLAFNVAPGGQAARIAPQAAADRRAEFFAHPIVALRVAMAPATTIANVRTVGAVRQADFTADDMTWTMTIDAAGVPLSISSRSANPNLGDVVITTTFGEYQDTDGVKLPAHIASKVDDFTVWELQGSKQSINKSVGDLLAPASVINGPGPLPGPPPAPVTAQQIGKGAWWLAGQSHHSVLIEFADHLMLIDAPLSEARSRAVFAKAKELVPGKPLTVLVTTHHHFDHTAGMRAAIAEGMTVVTQAGNKEWVEAMAKRPHTIEPDALAKNASPLHVETVDAEREFKDRATDVWLYHVAGNPHSDTMLMAYIPRDRTLIEVDAFSPNAAVNPYAANLLDNIRKRNLRVDTIVPLHGMIVPFAELAKAVGAKGN
jgi:glyoxylase-like metal-dependent hydrolase (beta-lactamase superfamily II)